MPLTPKAFDLLQLLVESAGHLKSREELIEALWPTTVVEETNLSWNVRAVRKALGDEGDTQTYIETVRGHGYRFIAPVQTEHDGEEAQRSRGKRKLRRALAAAGAMVVVGLAVAVLLFWQHPSSNSSSGAKGRARPAVAVLGFQNLSGDARADWIATALSEMVGTDLAAGGRLRTASAMDVARVRREFNLPAGGSALDHSVLHAIHENLDVRYVATGAYLMIGKGGEARLRVDVKLLDTKDGTAVATLSETGRRDELFGIVRSLGVGLRDRLDVGRLSAAEESEVRATIPASPAAARAYAQGLRALNAGDPVTAHKALEQAIALEPDFPLVYVRLAQAWMELGDEVNARAAAEKALDNSTALARPQRLLIDGLYREAGHEWGQAVADYRALFTFYPDDLQYGLLLARAQAKADKLKDSLATVVALRKLPPPAGDDPRVDLAEAYAADDLGDDRRTATAAERAVVTARNRGAVLLQAEALSHLGRSRNKQGKYAKALDSLDEARKLYERIGGAALGLGITLERIGNVYGSEGKYDDAVQSFKRANAIFARVGNRYWQGAALNNIGNVYYWRNNLAEARRYYDMALPMFRAIHRELAASYVLNNIAVIRGYQGDIAGEIEGYEEVLAIRRAAGAEEDTGMVLFNLSVGYAATGAFKKARHALEKAMVVYKKKGNDPGVSDVLASLADIDVQEDKLDAAHKLYLQALAIRQAKGMHNEIAENERNLAELALMRGKPAEAIKLAQSSAEEYGKEKADTDETRARSVLALAFLGVGRNKEAKAQFKLAQTRYSAVENIHAKLAIETLFAQIESGLGNSNAAIKRLQHVVQQADKLGQTTLAFWARFRLIEVQVHDGSRNAAVEVAARKLESDARSAGYLLVAREAENLLDAGRPAAAASRRSAA